MKEQLELILRQGLEEISSAARRDELENARVKYLGKKGDLTAVLKMMGKLDAAERPEDIDVNRALRAREEAEEALRQKHSMAEYQLAQGNLARALNRLRVSGKM